MTKRRKLVSIVALALAVIMTAGLIAGILATTVRAVSSDEIQQEIDGLKEQAGNIAQKKTDLEGQISAKQNDEADMIYQKSIIDQQMTITHEEIENTTAQIEEYTKLIADKEAELAQAEANESDLYEQYKDRLRAMEETGSVSYWAILFKAKSFSDLLDRIDMIQEIARADQEMMTALAQASENIRVARSELEESQAAMEEQKALLSEQEETLNQQSAEAQVYIDQIASESAELQSVYDQYDAMEEAVLNRVAEAQQQYEQALADEEAARLAAEEAERQAEEQRKDEEEAKENQNNNNNNNNNNNGDNGNTNNGGNNGGSSGGDNGNSSSPNTGTGTFIRPVSGGYISSPYGWRMHPTLGYEKFHYGVDYSVGYGTPIYAIASGTVTIATFEASCGNYVSVAHSDGYASAYMHMSSYVVSPGQYVSQGQLLGYVGSTGRSTGPHLHLAMYYNGSFVNPSDYVGG